MTEKKPTKKEKKNPKKLFTVSMTAGQLAIVVITILSVGIAGLAYLELRLNHIDNQTQYRIINIENHLQSRLSHNESLTQNRIAHNETLTQGRLENVEGKVDFLERIYAEFTAQLQLLLESDEPDKPAS